MSHSSNSLFLTFIRCSCGIALLVLGVMLPAAYAQHGGAGGHASGGGHAAGEAHRAGAGPAAHAHHSPHLTYDPHGERLSSSARNASKLFFDGERFRGRPLDFERNFGFFRHGFFPFGFWPWWGWSDCDSYDSNCDGSGGTPEKYAESEEDDYRPMIVLYLREGSGYGALDYWLENGDVNIETTYGTRKSFPMDQVDIQRTTSENAARGVTFAMHSKPRPSDPGSMFAPDSYAPACAASSRTVQPSSPATPASTTTTSWFGVAGRASDRGLAVDSVKPDSPAAELGIQSGDIVERINCQRIRSAQDLVVAVNGTGNTIWVSYLIQGTWLTEKKVNR